MRINRSFINIIFCFMVMPGLATAQEVVDLTSRGAVPVDAMEQVLPRWKSSLGEIQEASASLLETNAALTREYRQLKQDFDRLQAKVKAQRAQNMQIMGELSQWQVQRRQAVDPAELARLKGLLMERDAQAKAEKETLAAAKLRRASMESRLVLLRAQVADLEVVRQVRQVDMKAHDAARIDAVMAETERVKDREALTIEQTRLLTEKVRELARLQTPFLPEARALLSANDALKARLVALTSEKIEEQAQLSRIEALRSQADADRRVQRLRQLLAQRTELEARLKDNEAKMEQIKAFKAEEIVEATKGDEAQRQKLEQQNALMESETANLRENVALLEYKISTLERYQNRHKPAGKAK